MVEEKKYILFDHDGVLVETEQWYFQANKRALVSLGIDLTQDVHLANMANGINAWEAARASGISESDIQRCRELRNRYYQAYLVIEDIEGVLQTLAELANTYRMAIVTTSKRSDFALIRETRHILDHSSAGMKSRGNCIVQTCQVLRASFRMQVRS